MIKVRVWERFVFIVFLLFFTFVSVFANDCFFYTFNDSCVRLGANDNIFTITGISDNAFDHFEVAVYNKGNVENKLKFRVNDLSVSQLSSFLSSGVYVVEVKAYAKSGSYEAKKFEFIFDNTNPMPPIVPVEMTTQGFSYTVVGRAEPGSDVYCEIGSSVFSIGVLENGSFNLDVSLDAGNNYAKFYVKRADGMKSGVIERIIVSGNYNIDLSLRPSSITFDDLTSLNDRTVGVFTSKRNFYVSGTASDMGEGGVIFVNGVRAIVDSNNKFGVFVLLNEGENRIVARCGNVLSLEYVINYVDLKFKFVDVDYKKIVTQDSVSVRGDVSFDYPFLVFLNGEFLFEVNPSDEKFDFVISGLKAGKNVIEVRGVDNQVIVDNIYYDTQSPQVEVLSLPKVVLPSDLVFKITDDVGVNLRSLNLDFAGVSVGSKGIKVYNNYYVYELDSLSDGEYNYVLSGEDLAGRSFSYEGSVVVDASNTLIEDIYLSGQVLGNRIFLNSGDVQMTLVPSQNIAFESIVLDGVEQTSYEILSNDNVKLNLNIVNESGVLELNFINKNYEKFSESFYYYSDKVETKVDLDYVVRPYSTNKIKVSGEILDENLDWSSVLIGGQSSFTRYGDYFEALIDLKNSGVDNLVVSGSDFVGNGFSKIYGSMVYKDVVPTEVLLDKNYDVFEIFVSGSLSSDEYKKDYSVLNFAQSYDGMDLGKVYVSSDGFELPVSQRAGYRSLNLKGYEDSSLELSGVSSFKVDSSLGTLLSGVNMAPMIFFSGNDINTNNKKSFVQGQIESSSHIKSVKVNNQNVCVFDDVSFVCSVSLNEGLNSFEVIVVDEQNRQSKSSIVMNYVSDLSVGLNDVFGDYIYSSNGKNYLFGDRVNIKGDVSLDSVIKVLVNGNEFYMGDENSDFSYDNFDLSEVIDGVDSSDVTVQIEAEDEFGNLAFSERIVLIYKRVFDSFASVIVK